MEESLENTSIMCQRS